MRNNLVIEILAAVLLLTACTKPAAEPKSTPAPHSPLPELPFAQELQDVLDTWLEENAGVGISAAIVVPGYETWVGVSGVSYGTTPITPDTLFNAASITKMFTAVTILQLAEDGLLNLDDPLHKWLAEYPNIDNTITIRQLLNHTSGIYDMVENPEFWTAMFAEPTRTWNPEEIVSTFLLEPYFPADAGWHYSSSGYLLLHLIIKRATESQVSAEYRNRFWDHLDLDNTFLAPQEELPENTAHGWFDLDGDGVDEDISFTTSLNSGVGGVVFTTPEDMARWSQALFREGRILSGQSLDQMLTFHSPTPGEPLVAGYGLGVQRLPLEISNGLEVWGHLGKGIGYAAACLYLPDYGVSIGIMVNTDEDDAAMLTLSELLNITINYLEAAQN